MKLLRFGQPGAENPGILDGNGNIRNLSAHVADIDSTVLSARELNRLRDIDIHGLPLVEKGVRVGPCVGNIGKFICVGLNYMDHAAECGMSIPSEPVVFLKPNSAISGPNDDVILPRGSKKTDWEVELAVVIGRHAKYVTEEEALQYVAGYTIVNDVSEREYQHERGGTWDKGKGCDTFGPIGPWLVTSDEVSDPQNLKLWLNVNGDRMQEGSTSTMIFSVAKLVSYISNFMSLYPGDVISTGTPPGVGAGKKPTPIFVKAGQMMELGIEGLGTQKQQVVESI